MSEIFRKCLWVLLLGLAVTLLLTGFLPVKSPETQIFAARGLDTVSLYPIPRLSSGDLSNLGDAEALSGLPGVGSAIAQRIIHEREENGNFYYPEDLASVNGIGEKKLAQILPFLTVLSDEREE